MLRGVFRIGRDFEACGCCPSGHAALGSWVLAYIQRTTVRRHSKLILTAEGRFRPGSRRGPSLIVTGNAFRLIRMNNAVEKAKLKGLLATACRMVGTPATQGSGGKNLKVAGRQGSIRVHSGATLRFLKKP